MCIYVKGIIKVINDNINLFEFISSEIDINYYDLFEIYPNKFCSDDKKCSHYYILILIKYILSFKKRNEYINMCDDCIHSKNTLTYNTNNLYTNYINTKSTEKSNYYENEIIFILYQKKLNKDIINNILSYSQNYCHSRDYIMSHMSKLSNYSIYKILLGNKIFDKYFRIDKICEFNSNCANCEYIMNLVEIFEYLLEYYNIYYTKCGSYHDKICGFNKYIKYIH